MTPPKTTSHSEPGELERRDRADAERELREWALIDRAEEEAAFDAEFRPPPRPCEDGLVGGEPDPIDWRRDRDEDRQREQERWDEGGR